MDTLLYISGFVAVISTLMVITQKNAVHALLYLIVSLLSVSLIFFLLGAPFAAALEVIVYAGAIMMLILFVIMLIYLETEQGLASKITGAKIIASFITIILFLEIVAAILSFQVTGEKGPFTPEVLAKAGNVKSVGMMLYGKYMFPFEIASILLLIGIVGAVVLSKRRKD